MQKLYKEVKRELARADEFHYNEIHLKIIIDIIEVFVRKEIQKGVSAIEDLKNDKN